RRDLHQYLHLFADQPREHRLHRTHRIGEIQYARRENLTPAEGEQLLRQRGRTLARAPNLVEIGVLRARRIQALGQQLAVAVDDRQQVVEVVRHSAGQLTDGLHFLGLTVLLFHRIERVLGGPLLADVAKDSGEQAAS